jgi:hypothetical protein
MIMKTKIMLINVVLLLVMAGICHSAPATKESCPVESESRGIPVIEYLWYGFDLLGIQPGTEGKVSIDVTTTVQSKHMWHGIDLLDDHGVVIPSVGIKLGDTGFSGRVIKGYPLSKDMSNLQDHHYAAFYSGALMKDTPYATNIVANYFYYGRPELAERKFDSQEIGTTLFWPAAFNLGNGCLTPSYYVGYIWPTRSNGFQRECEGWIHVFGCAYNFEVSNFWGEGGNQAFKLFGDITYNDGFAGAAIEHDWSHAVLGISTDINKGNFTFTPFVNYQISMEDTVNNEDEFWCGLSTTYRF